MENRTIAVIVFIAITILLVVVFGAPFLKMFSLIGVSRVEIDPQTQGYEDPASGEWTGSFWIVTMSTDWDDQIAGFHLAANDGDPSETYAESLSGKTKVSSYTVDGKQLVPTADVMVHIQPMRPYYEREMEIQSGYYSKKTYATGENKLWYGKYQKTGIHTEDLPFIHWSFADVGGGNWVLHTPFTVDVYKNGELLESKDIDTSGKTGVYRIPASGEEFINIIDLGKLDTSGYGEPQWDDILYFSENHIFVRDSRADSLLRYDAGQTGSGATFYEVTTNSFNSYYYGSMRWDKDGTPAAVENDILYPMIGNNDFPGWYRQNTATEYVAVPRQPNVFSDVIPYLQNQGIQKVSMPTGFDGLEKVTGDQSKEYLRVYFKYGTKSSLVVVKISTTLADTIVWQPQVANFEITSFPDFGDVVNIRSNSLTVKCVEGAGSATVSFTKDPADAPISITPAMGVPRLEVGESYTLDFDVQNLGTTQKIEGEIIAEVSNVLGSVTDTATAHFTLLEKTGATTIVHVVTQYDGEPISNLAVMIEYAGTSQTKTTGIDGLGTATFNLGTSSDVTVTASYGGNNVYRPKTKSVKVSGGSETTITLNLVTYDEPVPEEFDWILWLVIGCVVAVISVALIVYAYRRWS